MAYDHHFSYPFERVTPEYIATNCTDHIPQALETCNCQADVDEYVTCAHSDTLVKALKR